MCILSFRKICRQSTDFSVRRLSGLAVSLSGKERDWTFGSGWFGASVGFTNCRMGASRMGMLNDQSAKAAAS